MSALRVAVYVTVDSADIDAWSDGVAGLESTIKARLSEVYTPEGDEVSLNVLGIEVDED